MELYGQVLAHAETNAQVCEKFETSSLSLLHPITFAGFTFLTGKHSLQRMSHCDITAVFSTLQR